MSKIYSLKTTQKIPAKIEDVWEFFSNANNLKYITPPDLGFKVINDFSNDKIYAGQIIEYTVKPVLGIPIYWMTEITHVRGKEYFIDEQRFGPYTLWHHQHHFKNIDGGVEMNDIVHYRVPFWFFGDIANAIFVKNQLKNIFQFRFDAVEKKFGKWTAG
jgi:ligand-binding SRPBCC domain-containing protein